ncbi:hypothetical protein TWF481_010756, partial [Arthrobotrys musiformis]
TPLSRAAEKGDGKLVTLLLNYGSQVDFQTEDNFSALCGAIEGENAIIVKFLLDRGAAVNYQYKIPGWSGRDKPDWVSSPLGVQSPLSRAAEKGSETIVTLLLKHGARSNVQDGDGFMPLSGAIESGSVTLVQLFLDLNVETNYPYISADIAIIMGNLQQTSSPLANAVIPGVAGSKYLSGYILKLARVLQSIRLTAADATVLGYLSNARPDFRTKDGYSPLLGSIEGGNATIIRLLLNKGVEINYHYPISEYSQYVSERIALRFN